jgi:hypothetical protein
MPAGSRRYGAGAAGLCCSAAILGGRGGEMPAGSRRYGAGAAELCCSAAILGGTGKGKCRLEAGATALALRNCVVAPPSLAARGGEMSAGNRRYGAAAAELCCSAAILGGREGEMPAGSRRYGPGIGKEGRPFRIFDFGFWIECGGKACRARSPKGNNVNSPALRDETHGQRRAFSVAALTGPNRSWTRFS